jgi:hypothetical protein
VTGEVSCGPCQESYAQGWNNALAMLEEELGKILETSKFRVTTKE